MRKQWMAVVGPVAAFLLVACGSSETAGDSAGDATSPSDADATVTTKLLEFDPEELTVTAGTPITWEAGDGIGHTVTTGTFTAGDNGLREAEQPDGVIDMPLSEDQKVSFTFDEPGTYTYYCSIHKGMNGEVEVTS